MTEPWIDTVLRKIAGIPSASDAVIGNDEDGLRAMVRAEGVYQVVARGPLTGTATAIARLKALAGVPAYIVDEPQDGRIDGQAWGFSGDLRASFVPTVRGPRAALRLPALTKAPSLTELGLPDIALTGLTATGMLPDGLLVVCGPTGSGKTTTIHALLAEITKHRPDRSCIAIEDPVERRLPGIDQIQVDGHRDLGFHAALRAVLRQDPDVIVVGEIRDSETASAAVRAALTGHLVITTVHCGRAHEVLPRLQDMGVSRELLLPVLTGVLAQRLVRLRHAACDGQGCGDCFAGFLGRRIVVDWLAPDRAAKAAWAEGQPPLLSIDMDQHALALLTQGMTTQQEYQRVMGPGAR